MKAEERHELKQNDLASWFQYGLPMFLKQNGSYLLLAVALMFLGFQLYKMYERKQVETRNAGWAELMMVQNPTTPAGATDNPAAKLQAIIDTYDIKELKAQAYLTLGTFYSRVILFPEQMGTVNVTKTEALSKAYDAYKKAGELQGDDLLVAAKARLGMAAVLEDQGNWDEAAKEYTAMAGNSGRFANTPFAELAAKRLASLDERRNAPRMAALIPTTPTSQPVLQLPGAFGPELPLLPGTGNATGGLTGFGAPDPSATAPAPVPAPVPGTRPE